MFHEGASIPYGPFGDGELRDVAVVGGELVEVEKAAAAEAAFFFSLRKKNSCNQMKSAAFVV